MDEEKNKTEEGNEEVRPKKKAKATKKKTKSTKKIVKSTKKPGSAKKVTKAKASVKPSVEEPVRVVKKEIPVTFTESKHKEKKRKSGGGGILLFVLLIILLLGGAFYRTQQVSVKTDEKTDSLRQDVSTEVSSLKDKLQNITQELEDQRREKEEKKKMQYTIESLGLTFTYPTELGSVTEEVILQGEGEDIEQTLMLTFSGNPDIWLSAATSEYEDATGLIYTGDKVNLRTLCTDPLSISESGYCDYMNIMSQESLEQVTVIGENPISNIVKSVPVNIESEIYSGLTINLSLGVPPVTGRNLFAPTPDDLPKEGLEEFLRNIIREDSLSLITVQNLSAFEEIIKSLAKIE